eukprot:scaffold92134_cov21-Tisochrysis_lutea.AAC.3
MVVVSQAEANRLLESDSFLVHSTVLGHTYGITRAAVARAQATGQVRKLQQLSVHGSEREAGMCAIMCAAEQLNGTCLRARSHAALLILLLCIGDCHWFCCVQDAKALRAEDFEAVSNI